MSTVDKFLGLAGMGSTLVHASVLKRFLSGVTAVVALTVISSTMAGMIAVVGFYALYLGLVHYGLDYRAAVVTVSGFAVILTAALATLAVLRWRHLREMPRLLETPVFGDMGRIAEAFINGLKTGRDRRPR
jgi:hypothetical protein